jgi:uroporphyrinogen-III synthase
MLGPLEGFTVGMTADRRAEEQAELLRRRGAKVLHGPAIRTIPLADDERLAAATASVIERPPDVVVLLTGLGTRGWFAAAEGLGVDDALREALIPARIFARGPKAAGAALGASLEVAWQASSETSGEVLDRLRAEGVRGRRIAVQRDGGAPALADELTSMGADVVDVPVYRWTTPDDPEPALRLIEAACDRRLDALTFTSSPAVENLLTLAREAGLEGAFRRTLGHAVRVACVGPVCAATARRCGVESVVQPRRARLGAMVQALVRSFDDRHLRFPLGGVEVHLRGSTVVIGDRTVALSPRERDVLEVLGRDPGRVVPKTDLLHALWGDGDPHTVEVTVARLRRRLGPPGRSLRTVPRRGYVLDVSA